MARGYDRTPGGGSGGGVAPGTYAPLSRLAPVSVAGVFRAQRRMDASVSNGTDTGVNSRLAYTSPKALTQVRLVYSNFSPAGSSGETISTLTNVTVKASVEYPAGTYVPVFFNGSRTIVVEPGAFVISEPVSVAIPAATSFFTRTFATVASSGFWPAADFVYAGLGEAAQGSAAESDLTLTGTITGSYSRAFGPTAIIIDNISSDTLRVLGIGDSIMGGTGDTTGNVGSFKGWFGRAFETTAIAQRHTVSGGRVNNYATGAMRIKLAMSCRGQNAAICNYGVNDVISGGRTLVQVQADLTALWNDLVARGMKVWQTTITPVSTSTDSWATVGNQTTHGNNGVRTALNDWIRTTPSPLSGYIEMADLAETARNSGIWVAGGTADGTHPVSTIHTAMASAINVAALRTVVGVTG